MKQFEFTVSNSQVIEAVCVWATDLVDAEAKIMALFDITKCFISSGEQVF